MHRISKQVPKTRTSLIRLFFAAGAALGVAACSDLPSAPETPRTLEASPSRPYLEIATTLSPIRMFATGFYHSCALKSDGTVSCWGFDGVNGGVLSVPTGLSNVVQISAKAYTTCALRADGTVICWGDVSWGRDAPPAGTFVQLAVGYSHVCALRVDGAIVCWGLDYSAQVTGGQWSPIAAQAVHAGPFTEVRAGGDFTCGRRTNETVLCWGWPYQPFHPPITPLDAFVQFSAGGYHSCGLRPDGTVACWGAGTAGTIDGATNHDQSVPPLGSFTQVVAGNYHSCAIRQDGTLSCWGRNDNGQATAIAGTFAQVSSGGHHNCAVRTNGTAACWGRNSEGQSTLPVALRTPQVITFTSAPPNPAPLGDSYIVTATGGGSGNPVGFISRAPTICSSTNQGNNSAVVQFLVTGTCVIAANQAGNASYAAASEVRQTIVVGKLAQSITFNASAPDPALLGASYGASATGGGSGNPVTFSSLTPAVCPLSGATVTFVAVGTCSIAADQAGNAQYDPALRATQTFSVTYVFGATTGGGFAAPVSNTAFNSARAGQSVPVKFDLGGDQGLLVLAGGYPQSVAIACPNSNEPVNVLDEVSTTAGQSSLSYDPTTALYTYVWKTNKAWAGTCREFVLKLADNTEHRAGFQFVK